MTGEFFTLYTTPTLKRLTMSTLKTTIQDAVKTAMRSQAKETLTTLRMLTAAIKQREVDERIELDDTEVLAVINKMVKQRRESLVQFIAGNRPDLAEKEQSELNLLMTFLPEQLSDAEVLQHVKSAITETEASNAKDMGKVMAILKPKLQGRADIQAVSAKVKELLS
jgi:uncharacterized protein YqeY